MSLPMMMSNINLRLVIVGCIALITSRFFSVAIIAVILNCFREQKIPLSHLIVMTYGGLRGAVAFYLALNLHTEYKDTLVTATSVLIIMTVIGLGSTTNCILKLLNWLCPQDKILELEEEQSLLDQQVERSDSKYSMGFFTKLEYYDENYGQKFLRKNGNIIHRNDPSEVELDDNDYDEVSSIISRREDMMEDFFNRDVRGGDLSPYRKLSLRFRLKSSEIPSNIDKNESKNEPIQSSKTIGKLDSVYKKKNNNLEIPNLERSTTPKHKNNIKNYKFSSESTKPLPVIIPLNIIKDEVN